MAEAIANRAKASGARRSEKAARTSDGQTPVRATALRAFVATVVAVSTVVAALVLWELRVVIALFFLGMILAAAMRPGVEALAERGVPRAAGVLTHYAVLATVLGVVLWFVVPTSLQQVQEAVGDVPTTRGELRDAVRESSGVKHEVLVAIQHRLEGAPSLSTIVDPAVDLTQTGLRVVASLLFVFAVAAYWIFERERVISLVLPFVPQPKRRLVRQTWSLVDLRLGAYVRGVILLVAFVSAVLSLGFWAIGLPYWLIVGVFAGMVEIIPVIGPFTAGAVAIGVGLTVSLQTAALAAAVVFGLRLAQDYVINPRVLGHAVALTPLTVLVAVTAAGFLFGPAWVPLATPFAALVATLVDVFIRDRDPTEQEVPSMLFPGQEVEPARGASR
jgi:predicted PurR-regulated permease PerM